MIADRLAEIRERAAAAARRIGRDPAEVELVAVSKRQPPERIRAAYEAGQRVFGENRAQELADHVELLPDDAEWHMIGHLQRNKVSLVAPLIRVLHSLDSERLARAWAPTGIPTYVQVNLAGESQKTGVAPSGLHQLLVSCAELGVPVIGLMLLPPYAASPEVTRRWFSDLRDLRDSAFRHHPTVTGLSMGMSGDFEVAIEEGSTSIRLGATIFGPRQE